MISAVLISYNEKNKLTQCLDSLEQFADEVVVVDIGSTDGTVEMLKEDGIKLFSHQWVPYADPIRNFALEKASGEWIIMLDPDERLTSGLKNRLNQFIKEPNGYVAVNIPFKNIFWGKWIKHTNFWPDKHIRFFKRGSVQWKAMVHSYPEVKGKVLELSEREGFAIEHYGYDNRWQFVKKQWKYSTSEAWNKLSSGKRFSPFLLIWMPLREFLARFIKHQGFKDGFDGIFLVGCLMFYQILVQVKLLFFQFGNKKRSY